MTGSKPFSCWLIRVIIVDDNIKQMKTPEKYVSVNLDASRTSVVSRVCLTVKKMINKKYLLVLWTLLGIDQILGFPTTVKKDLSSEENGKYNYTELSKTIQERLDRKVDPCDDFYEFACGGLLNGVEIPDDLDEIGMIGSIEESTRYQLLALLNQSVVESDIGPFKLAKTFFKKCMDEGLYLLGFFKESVGF